VRTTKAGVGANGSQPFPLFLRQSSLEVWRKLLGHVATATAILDRFLHHAEIMTITGKSYRLQNRDGSNGAKSPIGLKKPRKDSQRTKTPIG
jgi:hypothetical protein